MYNDFVAWDGCRLPGDISRPRKEQVMYMSKRIEGQEDPEAPFQVPVPQCYFNAAKTNKR